MKRILIRLLIIIAALYVIICIVLYIWQEKLIFFPEKLEPSFSYEFNQDFKELNFKTADGKKLNTLLFRADSSKGLIFYLHGNAGSLKGWGELAFVYTNMHYDVLMIDYRGFGKSEGEISSEAQFLGDVQLIYDSIKTQYGENRITVLGYSIGTGPAAWLASKNKPKQLILQAPYSSLTAMMHDNYSFVPGFLLKYKFTTAEYLKQCKMPVTIFHGTDDAVIDYSHSERLKPLLKAGDTLITLQNQGHNGITENLQYRQDLEKILK